MYKIPPATTRKKTAITKKLVAPATDYKLLLLAFNNSLQANIITTVSTGQIIMANNAASKLLGYSKKELLTQSRATIFDIKDSHFKKMLKQRTAEGRSVAQLTAIRKNGKLLTCDITSAIFMDENGIEKAITTIVDRSQSIREQQSIDTQREKVVANDMARVRSKQKKIDNKKEKIVAENIILAQARSDARLADNNAWVKYIAKTSYDVMWDWDIASGEIYVGDSIEEVFGYKPENNTTSFTKAISCMLPAQKNSITKKLKRILDSGRKSWNDSYPFMRSDGSIASTISRASIVRDEHGKATRLIGAIQDVSRLQELETQLAAQAVIKKEDNYFFQLAAKLSYDVIWDWNLLTSEFVSGEGFDELIGLDANSAGNHKSDWRHFLHPEDKETVEKGLNNAIASGAAAWEDACRIFRTDGAVANVFVRASIIRNANEKAYRVIGVIHDLSRQKELEGKLKQQTAMKRKLLKAYRENFKFIFNSSSDVLFDVDLISNKMMISDAYKKEFGYKLKDNMTPVSDWLSHIHPDDKDAILKDYERMIASGQLEWNCSYRFLKTDQSVATVISNSIILRTIEGKAYRMLGSMYDTSKQKVVEEKLELEIKLKERQIAEAMEAVKQTTRSDIGRELHDNVNQLLGASKVYLDMAKRGGESSVLYLNRSSQYTLTAIEEIRKLTRVLTTDILPGLGLSEAIDNIARETMEANHIKISCALESFVESDVNDKFKQNVFRIVQEQLNNILKHARATEVIIGLLQNKTSIVLTITDNGVGFKTGAKQKGIGLSNIKSRAVLYNGTANLVSEPGKGCILTATFPIYDALLQKS